MAVGMDGFDGFEGLGRVHSEFMGGENSAGPSTIFGQILHLNMMTTGYVYGAMGLGKKGLNLGEMIELIA